MRGIKKIFILSAVTSELCEDTISDVSAVLYDVETKRVEDVFTASTEVVIGSGNVPTYNSEDELEEGFWDFYAKHCLVDGVISLTAKNEVAVISYYGYLNEATLFKNIMKKKPKRKMQGPCPLHEFSTYLGAEVGYPAYLDYYINVNGIEVNEDKENETLYKCYEILEAYKFVETVVLI